MHRAEQPLSGASRPRGFALSEKSQVCYKPPQCADTHHAARHGHHVHDVYPTTSSAVVLAVARLGASITRGGAGLSALTNWNLLPPLGDAIAVRRGDARGHFAPSHVTPDASSGVITDIAAEAPWWQPRAGSPRPSGISVPSWALTARRRQRRRPSASWPRSTANARPRETSWNGI